MNGTTLALDKEENTVPERDMPGPSPAETEIIISIMETYTSIEKPWFGTLNSDFFIKDLPRFTAQIKNDCGWKMGDLKSVIVLNNPGLKAVLTAFHPRTEIELVQQNEATVIHVIEGALMLNRSKNPVILTADQKFTIYGKARYKLEALTEALFLLIQYPRVK